MPQKGSVECWISTASGRLPEYDDPEQNEITVGKATSRTTYIESKPGEEFYIGFQVHDPWGPDLGRPLGTTDLACKIIADGVDTKYTTVCANLVESPYSIREVKDLRRTNPKGDPEMYRLVFSDMELTEDSGDLPGGLIDYKKAAQVGEIRVHVSRYKRTGADIPYKPPSTADKTVKAHEKELKGRDIKHTVKYVLRSPTNS